MKHRVNMRQVKVRRFYRDLACWKCDQAEIARIIRMLGAHPSAEVEVTIDRYPSDWACYANTDHPQ